MYQLIIIIIVWIDEVLSSCYEGGKIGRCEGIMLQNGHVMKEVENEGYTYLGIVKFDTIKENEMKERQEYSIGIKVN